jgi:Ca-activated chloride channel family protein
MVIMVELLSRPLQGSELKEKPSSTNFMFATAVVELGLLLRNYQYKGTASFQGIIDLAEDSIGPDQHGYRNEFVDLVKKASSLVQP